MSAAPRPLTLLIAALGGEGGGVLTAWIVRAAESRGLAVQSTSIPGVAQRTGATTYYVEIFPIPVDELGGRRPVLSLLPSVGDVDVMVASEIVEAGRAIQNGYVTPDRTTLIASTHRVYAIGERSAMGDARFDSGRIAEAAARQSRRALLSDFDAVARDHGTVLNAVLLGVVAGSDALTVPAEAFRDAIRADGRAVESNLAGFEAGMVLGAAETPPAVAGRPADAKRLRRASPTRLDGRVRGEFPDAVRGIVSEGVRRLVDYQGRRYASLYLDRLAAIRDAERAAGGDMTLTRETARHLALSMSYEDVIRVAQLKAGADRYARVLDEVGAGPDEPVRITEFFRPGIEEMCSVLPSWLARPVMHVARRRGWLERVHVGMRVKTTTVNGFLRLRLLAALRWWRPMTWRYREEQARIGRWLEDVTVAAEKDTALALEVVECARLIKGYGDTARRGLESLRRIREAVIAPALAGEMAPSRAADAVANARVAALADPAGARLGTVLDSIAGEAVPRAAE